MKWEPYEYSGYKGRSTTHDKLKLVAAVLAVLVVLALGALLLGQRYIVYGDNGLRVEAPFLKEQPTEQKDLTDEITVVVEPAGSQT